MVCWQAGVNPAGVAPTQRLRIECCSVGIIPKAPTLRGQIRQTRYAGQKRGEVESSPLVGCGRL